MLQETFLKPNRNFYIKGYQTYRKDRTDGPKGGVALCIKTIKTSLLELARFTSLAASTLISALEECPRSHKLAVTPFSLRL